MKTNSAVFSGAGIEYTFITMIYNQLMTRQAVSYVSVMCAYKKVDESYFDNHAISSEKKLYTPLKKAFLAIRNALEAKESGCLKTNGKTKGTLYWYEGKLEDPLKEERQAVVQKTMEDYVSFCKASSGLLPTAWMSAFFENTQLLLETERNAKNGNAKIQAGLSGLLKNIDLLPTFYRMISQQQVCRLTYQPFGKESWTTCFHPQYLKEYNGRWFVFGRSEMEGKDPLDAWNIALDRIDVDSLEVIDDVEYKAAEPGFYDSFFNNIIGVSHEKGEEVVKIILKTHSVAIHGLLMTKMLHPSQEEMAEYKVQDDGRSYGLIALTVEPNRELRACVLAYGNGVEVMSPKKFREQVAEVIRTQNALYNLPSDTISDRYSE